MSLLGFLDAINAVKKLPEDAPKVRLLLVCGHTYEAYVPFLRGYAAQRGVSIDIDGLPFGTLAQTLRNGRELGNAVCVLYPWDLASKLDWYTGLTDRNASTDQIYSEASEFLEVLQSHPELSIIYVSAPIPPSTSSVEMDIQVGANLALMVAAIGGHLLTDVEFSLNSYLSRGIAAPAAGLSCIAEVSVSLYSAGIETPKKVLVTDLDNTLWSGIVGEDGPAALVSEANGAGHIHHLYQTYLRGLKESGALIAVASRNSLVDAEAGLAVQTAIKMDDIIAVMADYGAKSSMILSLADKLNLGIESFVFVDDNLIEIEEVSTALPEVTCIRFPDRVDDFPEFLSSLGVLFDKSQNTNEDTFRTESYRQLLKSTPPPDNAADRLRPFLRDQQMILTVYDRSQENQTRALQLINKTSQFNLNGRRWREDEINQVLADGGRLLSASLADRSGRFGEIIALLMDADHTALAYVMSCRAFQRRAEHAFLFTLNELELLPTSLDYQPTDKNEPFRAFMGEFGATSREQICHALTSELVNQVCGPESKLFTIGSDLP